MRHYLITGGTGLIGSAMIAKLLQKQQKITILTRDATRARQQFGDTVRILDSLNQIRMDDQYDIVINLAGAPIADRRWSKDRKQEIIDSRVNLTDALVRQLSTLSDPPCVFLSGSAIGWYGAQGDEQLDENAGFNPEFTHQLCQDWEQAALQAEKLGSRVYLIRTGLVLSPDGGFLEKMLPAFKLGIGGRLGNGQQYMSWIHVNDLLSLFEFCIGEEGDRTHLSSGVYNGTAPNPVSNRIFTHTLAQALNRPAILPAPAFALRLALGEMSRLLLTGQRVIPQRALDAGFKFQFEELLPALRDVLKQQSH